MVKYFAFNRIALATIGVNLEKNDGWLGKLLRYITATFLLLTTFQNVMTVSTSSGFSFLTATAISIGLCSLTAMVKLLVVWRETELLCEIKAKTREVLDFKDERVSRKLRVFAAFVNGLFITTIFCSWTFNVLPGVNYIVSYSTSGEPVEIFPFAFWYPFKKENHFLKVYFYEIVCVHFCTFTTQVLDGLLLLLLGQLTVCFDSLAEKLQKSIEETAAEGSMKALKIKEFVDLHVELLELSQKLTRIFEIPMFANVVYQTGLICFTEFIITISSREIIIASCFALFTSFMQIFVLCWFGEKIVASTLEVGDAISRSNFHELDESSKKNLLIVQLITSQRTVFLRGSKFFKLTLLLFTSVCSTSFSYFTIVRQVYMRNESP